MDHLTTEKRKTAERVRKLEAERDKLLKQVMDTTLTVQKLSDVVHIPGSVWWKGKMFDVDLKNAGHVSGSKMVNFIMDQGSKMDASMRTLKALIANCTELFFGVVESSEEEESSSSYSDLSLTTLRKSRCRGGRWKPTRGRGGTSGGHHGDHCLAGFHLVCGSSQCHPRFHHG